MNQWCWACHLSLVTLCHLSCIEPLGNWWHKYEVSPGETITQRPPDSIYLTLRMATYRCGQIQSYSSLKESSRSQLQHLLNRCNKKYWGLQGSFGSARCHRSQTLQPCAISIQFHFWLLPNQHQLLDFIQSQVLDRKNWVEGQCSKIQERYGGVNSLCN